jgi:hypothetical protein
MKRRHEKNLVVSTAPAPASAPIEPSEANAKQSSSKLFGTLIELAVVGACIVGFIGWTTVGRRGMPSLFVCGREIRRPGAQGRPPCSLVNADRGVMFRFG